MKKLYVLSLFFFVIILFENCSLNTFFEEITNKKNNDIVIGKPFTGIPTNIVIDDNDNGIISFRDEIIQIKNLEIANKILLKDQQEKDYVGNTSYSVDKDGNGILIYSRQGFYLDVYFYYSYPENNLISKYFNVFNNYAVKISKNNFLTNETKKIYATDIYYKNPNIIKFDKNNFLLSFLSDQYVKLEKIKNFNLEKPEVIEYNFLIQPNFNYAGSYAILDLNFNLDSQGNGWYCFKTGSNYDFKKLEKYKIVYDINELAKGSNIIYNNLDYYGNGYILNYKDDLDNNSWTLSEQNINNFKKSGINNKILKLKKNYYFPYFFSIDSKFINLNTNGNGIIFLNNDSNINGKVSLIVKKFENFKEVEESIISDNNRNYNCYASSINNKGNGFLITQDYSNNTTLGSKSFILKRIKNYEVEK